MLGVQVQRKMPGVFDRALSWLAFLNGHRLSDSEVRPSTLAAADVESVRQVYVR